MSDPSIGFIVIRDGVIESAPEGIPTFNLDVLQSDFLGTDTILDVKYLRSELVDYMDSMDPGLFFDVEYFESLIAECDAFLASHDDNPCNNCGALVTPTDADGGVVWTHHSPTTECDSPAPTN